MSKSINAEAGFSLIEVLAALLVTMLLVLTLSPFVSQMLATWARGGHIEQPTRLQDLLERTGADRFLLHGRVADLVNIAGKRSSLAYLNHQLNSIPGVEDGAFFHVEDSSAPHTGIARVAACVVAPSLGAERLLTALRERIDAVFLPRPLVFVARLPRNDTGKLPLSTLRSLAARAKPAAMA